MITKKIFSIFLLGVSLLVFWYIQNGGLPLGYDHGAYKHIINLLWENQNLQDLPKYLKHQFEPFSGTFFYSLTAFTGQEVFFWWGYLGIFILTWVSLFLLGKKKRKYTVWSYLWLFLFFFSAIQYINLWWAFGKQMFATFFLILLIRYYRNSIIAFILMAACLSLHRLTGFVAISYFLFTYLFSQKRNLKHYYALLIGLWVAAFSYFVLFYEQVFPLIRNIITNPQNQVFIQWKYGTGFSGRELFFYLVPVLLMVFLGLVQSMWGRGIREFLKKPHTVSALLIGLIVVFRSIAHTRLWTFLDLFLIIIITRSLYHLFDRKWIYVFIITQCVVWGVFVNKWHTPFIDQTEYKIIRDVTRDMPRDVTLVTLSWAYMSWLTGYTHREIYSPHQWIWQMLWTSLERKNMKYIPNKLCNNLSKLPWNVVIYIGARENYSSLKDNPCITEVQKWQNGSRLFLHLR